MHSEKLILVGNCGAGWTPTIPDMPIDENSYGQRLLRRIKELRINGMNFQDALTQAKIEIPKGE
jgi:hypothetical protein